MCEAQQFLVLCVRRFFIIILKMTLNCTVQPPFEMRQWIKSDSFEMITHKNVRLNSI